MPEINSNPFSRLLPENDPQPQDTWRWGTVTGVDPLLVRLDGDSQPFSSTPDTIISVKVGDRVRVHIYNRRATVMGVKGGGGGSSPLSAYPIGSYYWSSEPTNPTEIFGGAWERVQGRFLFATDNKHPVGSTGGEETHRLTEAEIPRHTHRIGAPGVWSWGGMGVYQTNFAGGSSWQGISGADSSARGIVKAEPTGGGQAHNNMPPYISAYCWRRVR